MEQECECVTKPELKTNSTNMPAFRVGKIRRKGCSLARRTKFHSISAWRILYRLLFMVSAFMGQNKRMETKHLMGVYSDHLIAFQFGADRSLSTDIDV